ncbi:hypothetical protein [Larkinella rosea]|uniref:Lipocalin-like domain-containing protein n=1 Tax=Larkinella rosea TaxID=2025312 RepID=A0A3P1BMP8_9BACT|nr:hypothetical protein [Larkinella rosea]RRB02357.1 hypothetical protein EHT25_17965 [Larkinella rosea]
MKTLGYLLLTLCIVLSCKKSEPDTLLLDPLYQNWKLIEYKGNNSAWRTVTDESFIEFRIDGSIRYEKPNPPCCAAVQVDRKSDVLKVTQTYSGPGCEYVDCASPSELRIVSLTTHELVIESILGNNSPVSNGFLKYKPAK